MQDLISIAGIKLRLNLYAHVMLLCLSDVDINT
jgi:hypothetical protein